MDRSLTSDANKGISVIEYNYLKLPRRVVQNGVTTLIQHDALGKKLKETIASNFTDYSGNKIYKNSALYQISHDEGRIVDGQYEYFINDHLGNLRVSFRDSSGIAKISQKQDYDPYGSELQKISYLKNSWKQSDFKFSGKEFEPQTGLNDFGWRRQDPILGRMWGIDNRAEKYYSQSPMQFTLNNPIINVDGDGDSVSINYVQGGGKNGRDLFEINFTGKVLDNTTSGLSSKQLSRIANQISSQFVSSFSGKDKNVEYRATANITAESSSNPLVASDHAIRVVDDVATTIGQVDPPGGNIEGFGKPQQNYVYLEKGANYGRTGTHELGHSFGLAHIKDLTEIRNGVAVPLTTNDYFGNLMHQGQDMNSQGLPSAGMKIESFQVKEIYKMYMIPALNRGKQKK